MFRREIAMVLVEGMPLEGTETELTMDTALREL